MEFAIILIGCTLITALLSKGFHEKVRAQQIRSVALERLADSEEDYTS